MSAQHIEALVEAYAAKVCDLAIAIENYCGDEARLKEAEDAHAAAKAALLAAYKQEWLPIESAPKDGRTVLLGYANDAGKWRTMRGQWFTEQQILDEWDENEGCLEGWYETSVENDDCPNCWQTKPTRWMPLPLFREGV